MTDRLIRWLRVPPVVAALMLAAPQGRAELRAEYFWNDDPGVGRATALTLPDGGADGFRAASVPVTGMRDGLNMLGIRARNAGQWSVTHTAMVWSRPSSPADVEAAEYFWNDDPGVGAATPLSLPGGDGLRAATLDASGLAEGEHLLGLRVRGPAGWSVTHTARVLVRGSVPLLITGLEYFWG
ncbi:MAG: hypothetical protein NC117_10900, partial [Pseudoflavonifractor sp.]|nr:hypothetical protein [Pseudoflavonifractor sp.]